MKKHFKQTDVNSLRCTVIDSVHDAPITNPTVNGSITSTIRVIDSLWDSLKLRVYEVASHIAWAVHDCQHENKF